MTQQAVVSGKEGPATAVEAAAGLQDVWWRRLLFVPTIGLLLLLAIVPLIFSLGVSLFNYSIGSKPIWLGLGNYINMFTDPQFWLATKVTVQFTVVAVSRHGHYQADRLPADDARASCGWAVLAVYV